MNILNPHYYLIIENNIYCISLEDQFFFFCGLRLNSGTLNKLKVLTSLCLFKYDNTFFSLFKVLFSLVCLFVCFF